MKARLVFFWIMLLTGWLGHSQARDRGTFEVIPIIGFTSSNIYGTYGESTSNRYDYQAGVMGDYYFNDRWSIRSGLAYYSMGTQGAIFQTKLDYLNIPVNANWHFGSTRKWNLNFGLTPGFLLAAERQGEDLGDMFHSFHLASCLGIGYKLEITKNFSLLFDYQSLIGLTKIDKEPEYSGIRNSSSSFNLGAVFAF